MAHDARTRGYLVHQSLGIARESLYAALIAARGDQLNAPLLQDLLEEALQTAWVNCFLVDELEDSAELDVATLSAPIFDLEGAVSFVAELSLHSAHTPLEVVVELGTRLAATAHQITAAGGGADPWRTNI